VVAFALTGVLAVLAAALTVTAAMRVSAAQSRVVGDLFEAYPRSAALLQAALDQETGVRGYALTGQDRFLEPYVKGQAREQAHAGRLRVLLEDTPALTRDVDRLQGSIRAWRETYADPTIAAVRDGQQVLGENDLAAEKRGFDRIRAEFADYRSRLIAVRADGIEELRIATRTLLLVVGLGICGLVVVGAVLWVVLRRWVTDPLAAVSADVREVAAGELLHPIAATGPPEIARLATEVDGMRQRILAEYAAANQARQEALAVTERLVKQAEDLRRSNTELEQFAYVASHDLQEPLRKITSFCQLLERRYAGQLDERGEQYIAFAVDGAKRMQRLINDLLAFSRVGRAGLTPEPVDLGTALDQALHQLAAALEDSRAMVTHDPLPVVAGDRGLLVQLFQNLLGNAVKFRGDQVPRVHVAARSVGEFVEVSCTDNGIGIEPQYADRIFVIFQRLHAKDAYDGTGIGLALCRKIVEHHGGRIWLDQNADDPRSV
jgi:signal transduction histidine kinase